MFFYYLLKHLLCLKFHTLHIFRDAESFNKKHLQAIKNCLLDEI
jgi:hypothetical protein